MVGVNHSPVWGVGGSRWHYTVMFEQTMGRGGGVFELGLNCFAKNLCQWWRHSAVSTVRTQKYRDGIRSFRDFRFGIQEGRETGDAGRPFEQKRLWKSNGVGAVPALLIMVEQNMEGGGHLLWLRTPTRCRNKISAKLMDFQQQMKKKRRIRPVHERKKAINGAPKISCKECSGMC